MSVPQHLVIETIRRQCEQIEERYSGYRKELVGYLAEILSIERASPKNTVQQITAQLEAFGDLYHRRRKASESPHED
jgi:hypothetical protein